MSQPARRAGPDLPALFGLFPPADDVPQYTLVHGPDVPEPYHGLLVHEHHMTVTVESFYNNLVDVRVLERVKTAADYARKILLTLQGSGRVVQFGIMREHNVLRRIEPTAYLRVTPGAAMMQWFGLAAPLPTYGRLALIHCNEQPAVELLEIVAPITERIADAV
jgi:hypothetical protein